MYDSPDDPSPRFHAGWPTPTLSASAKRAASSPTFCAFISVTRTARTFPSAAKRALMTESSQLWYCGGRARQDGAR
eukprot:3108864-Pleurochrysis_carterae.AAC.4